MSYADGNSGNRNGKALTGGVVALIQGGIVIALVNGLAVQMFAPKEPRNLPSHIFPTAPMTPDMIEPPRPEEATKAQPRESRVTAPEPRFVLPAEDAFNTGVIVDPVLPTGVPSGFGEGDLVVTPMPSDPPARFVPRTVRPRGDQARWVTTNDYPTAELRAGHAGTVRFRLAIDGSGKVTGCTVTQSSGYVGLDDATCRNVARRARFDAASDGSGAKVAGTFDGTIRWVIPQD